MLTAGFEDVETILRQPTAGGGAYTRTYTCTYTHIQTHIKANILIYTHIYIYNIYNIHKSTLFDAHICFPKNEGSDQVFLKGEKWVLDKSFLRIHRDRHFFS